MPVTTRYSATFDRPYEEEEHAASNGMRRSRSQSLQHLGLDGRPYMPLENNRPMARSSSTDSGANKTVESIPTRTLSKPAVKTHNNPFQFVKVGSSPLYKKAEEQLKKVKEVKKVEVLKEEEEEWQSNLDSWKSRRRKMSEDIFRRQEEIRQLEQEQQQCQEVNQKKIKTFSEMVESRANRGRALSLCLISSPLELQQWDLENNNAKKNGTQSYSEGSEENSAVNSEDDEVNAKGMLRKNFMNKKSQSTENIISSGSSACKNKNNRLFELGENSFSSKDGTYFDSGLESISSSHRAGDTPDSCSDFSQDSGSCIDCDSPRVSGLVLNGVNLLEEFNSKDLEKIVHHSSFNEGEAEVKPHLEKEIKNEDFSFSLEHQKKNPISASNGHNSTKDSSIETNGYSSSIEQTNKSKSLANGNDSTLSKFSLASDLLQSSENLQYKEKQSIESENEVFVDDFEDNNNSEKFLKSESLKCKDPGSKNQEHTKETSVSQSQLSSCTGLFTVKIATVIETDLMENPTENCTNPSVGLDSEFNNLIKVAKPKVEEAIKSVQHSEDDSADIVVKIKKPKTKKPKKKVDAKNVSSKKPSNQSSDVVINNNDLNVIFQSSSIKEHNDNSSSETKSEIYNRESVVLNDVPPVEQVAEEMERLILQQLEEEERAKELSMKVQPENILDSPEHNLLFRSRSAEPPKEKPPPPPNMENDVQKTTSLKRVNSTKRIKKEICKRRSNFLGIENDENAVCDEISIPPPPALEQILKAEMELDRESRKKMENATTERLILEENEIRKREQEIIETVETEERQKHLINNCEDFSDMKSDCTEVCDIIQEGDRIEILKEERKRMEKERILTEEQRLRLIEEKQLREREEFLRKQEGDNANSADISAPILSGIANLPNASKTQIASLSSEAELNVLKLDVNGDGEHTVITPVSDQFQVLEETSIPIKPAIPPKPLKKKEAIRKERERLRQEQEALVREREEHRRKLKEEEELLKSHQNFHAPDAPVSRLGPLPSLIKPAYTPQLTSPINAQSNVRENAAATSRNYHALQTDMANSSGCVEPVKQPVNKYNKPIPPPKRTVKSELRGQPKVSSIKKQSHDPVAESKYNQNHWLIQEAEMRRITELKERQRASQFSNSQTHLAEDGVCSVSMRAPVLSPNMQLNNPVQEKVWNYGHSNMPIKKYPPPISTDKPLGTHSLQPPAKPSRVIPVERHEQMLSVSGRKRCSHCNEELGRGAAMIIESLQLYYHIHCFQCCVCQAQLGNGSCGADVRVRNNKLHCHNCYSNDEAGLKFSQV